MLEFILSAKYLYKDPFLCAFLFKLGDFTSRGRHCHILTISGVLIEAEYKPIEHKVQNVKIVLKRSKCQTF